MKEYTRKWNTTIVIILFIILINIIIYLLSKNIRMNEDMKKVYLVVFCIISILSATMTVIVQRKYKILVDQKRIKICRLAFSGIEERNISWDEIKAIKYEGNLLFEKIIKIAGEYNSVSFTISGFKHYKELLITIVRKIENNKNIIIESEIINTIS